MRGNVVADTPRRADLERGVRQAVAERVRNRKPARLVPAVADEHAFAVAHLAVLAGEVAVRRVVLESGGKRGGQATARLVLAEQHVGERVRHLLAAEPGDEDRGHRVGPVDRHR